MVRRGRAAAAIALLTFAAPVFAQHGIAVLAGNRAGVDSVGLQWALPSWYTTNLGSWRVTGYPELQLSHHSGHGDKLVQAGAYAAFRFEPPRSGLRPYFEAGLGINLLSRDNLGDREFSTRFQFGQFLGAGLAWGGGPDSGGTWAGARIGHFSNANIEKPNDGLDTMQFVLGHRF